MNRVLKEREKGVKMLFFWGASQKSVDDKENF